MSKTSTSNQVISQFLSEEEKVKRERIVSLLRDRENGWLAFIEDTELKRCMIYACRACSLPINPREFANALFIALLDSNYAESWATVIEKGEFCNGNTGDMQRIDSVLGWMIGRFRALLGNIEFMKYLYGDPRIMYQSLSVESRLRHDDDKDNGNNDKDCDSDNDNAMTSDAGNQANNGPVVTDDERNEQLEEVLRLVGEQPKVGSKYRELIVRYFIKHDDLECIAADFLKKGWIQTDNKNNPVGAAGKTIQNRTVPKARNLFDKIAGENGLQCRISDLRRKKTERKKNRKKQ